MGPRHFVQHYALSTRARVLVEGARAFARYRHIGLRESGAATFQGSGSYITAEERVPRQGHIA